MPIPTARGAKRILWVDDEVHLLKPHLLFLEARGYHVDPITNGDDALELLREHSYDLVLLDEQMSGRRGLEVLELIRRDDPHQRVVMVTKSQEDRTMTEAIGRRVDDYLVKPFELEEMLARIRAVQRRPNELAPDEIAVGDLVFDMAFGEATGRGRRLELQRREMRVLITLVRRRGRTVLRESLEERAE